VRGVCSEKRYFEMLIIHEPRVGLASGSIGLLLYVMATWSYTFAVFTSPGVPMDSVRFPSSYNLHGADPDNVTEARLFASPYIRSLQFRFLLRYRQIRRSRALLQKVPIL
jgi:hypothetical protein